MKLLSEKGTPDVKKPERELAERYIKHLRRKLKNPKYLPSLKEMNYSLEYDKRRREERRMPTLVSSEENKLRILPTWTGTDEFNLLSQEYISALADHLVENIRKYRRTIPRVQILEVGAGSGRLSYFLSDAVYKKLKEEEREHVAFASCDVGEWKIKPLVPVDTLSAEQAMKKYQPTIIISSWPRYSLLDQETDAQGNERDALKEFPCLQEIIYIGDTPTCHLWGIQDKDKENDRGWNDTDPPDFEGMSSKPLTEAMNFQRYSSGSSSLTCLQTISFVRE